MLHVFSRSTCRWVSEDDLVSSWILVEREQALYEKVSMKFHNYSGRNLLAVFFLYFRVHAQLFPNMAMKSEKAFIVCVGISLEQDVSRSLAEWFSSLLLDFCSTYNYNNEILYNSKVLFSGTPEVK